MLQPYVMEAATLSTETATLCTQVGLAMYDSWRAVAFAGHWPADNPSGPQRTLEPSP
jgi:hypothetical protein